MTRPRSTDRSDARSSTAVGVSLWQHVGIELPGLLICVLIAVAALGLARNIGGLSAGAASISLGLLVGSTVPGRQRLEPGIRRSSTLVLGLAIALMGLTIPLSGLPSVSALLALAAAMLITLSFAALLGRAFGLGLNGGLLGGMGSAVCGSAAIAASSGVLRSSAALVAAALASVNLLSAAGMVALPALAHAVGLDDTSAGWWTGGSLQAVGQAIGGGFAFSPAAGETATAVKLFRVTMLLPLLLGLGLATGHRRRPSVPWFVPGFVVGTVIVAVLGPQDWAPPLVSGLLAVALAGIGAMIQPRTLLHQGPRMLLLCVLAFLMQFAGVLAILKLGLAKGS
jgi:uncharacterized integral membrane protein (TIGR00698 family)